jgi:hemerythrin
MLIQHENVPQVSQPFMNKTHAEDVDLINALFHMILAFERGEESASNIDISYQTWIEHTIEHFTTEEIEMLEASFPPYHIHKGEHDRILEQMHEVLDIWENSRDIKVLKHYFIEVIPEWLVTHISTMDAMTAHYIGGGSMPGHGGMGF